MNFIPRRRRLDGRIPDPEPDLFRRVRRPRFAAAAAGAWRAGSPAAAEELGGLRAVEHYMQRTAIQGSLTMLAPPSARRAGRGAQVVKTAFTRSRKYFEEIQLGDEPAGLRATR